MNDSVDTIKPPRWLTPIPMFLSEQAFMTLKALYEMDEQDADMSYTTEKARYDHHRDRGMPDWYREYGRQKHPLGKHPRSPGNRGYNNHDWGWRELFDAGLLLEQGWFSYRITPNGRAVYEQAAARMTPEYVAV